MNPAALVCGALDFENLRSTLLQAAPNEAAALLLCCAHETPKGFLRILVKEIVYVPHDAYLAQEPAYLSISPIFLARVMKRARSEGFSVVLTHTHPLSKHPVFSAVDDAGEAKLIPVLQNRIPGRIHGALVLGEEGFQSRFYEPNSGEKGNVERIDLNGAYVQRLTEKSTKFVAKPEHDRNVRAFGSGQETLQRLNVGIVGLGGVGSVVAQQLAYLGIQNMLLVDFDSLEITNLNRVVGATRSDVGNPKVAVSEKYLKGVSPGISIETNEDSVLTEKVGRQLMDCDFVFSCTDSHGSRAVLNQLAYQYLIPTIDIGVRIDALSNVITAMAGRVQMLASGLPCLVCGNLLNAEEVRRDFLTDEQRRTDPYIVGHAEPQPAIISINSALASLAVTMFLSAVVRLPSTGRHLIYLVQQSIVRRIGGDPNPKCVVCSQETALASGDNWKMVWKS